MPSTELGLVCQSRTLRWLLAAGAGLGALSWLLEAVGWFALSATNTVTTLDLARASAWLWCAAAAVVLAGFVVASWEAFVATGHGELVAWRSAGVVSRRPAGSRPERRPLRGRRDPPREGLGSRRR